MLAIEGDLSIRGVTKPVRIPVTLTRRGARLVVVGSTRLQWAEYGVPEGLQFGFPVRSDGSGWSVVEGLEHDDFAKGKIEILI